MHLKWHNALWILWRMSVLLSRNSAMIFSTINVDYPCLLWLDWSEVVSYLKSSRTRLLNIAMQHGTGEWPNVYQVG
jgi:hypothetical protein